MTEISLSDDFGLDRARDRAKERNATICSCCAWAFVLIVCGLFWWVGTDPQYASDPDVALGFLVLVPVLLIGFVVSLYKIGRAALKIYKLS
jgi:apolipoprotein N-acyltransferase